MSRSRRVAAVLLVVTFALGVGSSAVLARTDNAFVSSSALTVVDGAVLVSHAGADFAPASEGDVLAAGDAIRTGDGASAEVTYFDGSSVRLEADAEIVVMGLRTDDGRAVQLLGRAWHAVTRLISGDSRYETRTPSSTASVRG
jgi:hypothetical protein